MSGVVDHHRLAFVVDVLVDGDDVALGIEAALEGHEGRSLLEMGRVELEGDLHNALGRLGGELGGGGHGVASGVDQRLAGRLVDERTVCGVGFARDEAPCTPRCRRA